MSQWPMVLLGEVLREQKQRIGTIDASGLPLLGVSNAEGLHHSGMPRISDMSRYLRVERSWFAYNPMRINVGSIGWAESDEQTGVISPDYIVFSCTERIEPRLVYLFLKERRGLQAINAETAGSVRERLYFDSLARIEFPLPPIAEQRRLVDRIGALAAKIDEAKRLREEANQGRGILISSLHLHLSKGRTLRVCDILELHEDRVPVRHGEEYPQIGVKGFGEGLFARAAITADQTTYKHFNRLFSGALVLSQVKGWEGAVAVCQDQFAGRYASPEYRTFRCKDKAAHPEYLAAIVPTPWFWGRLALLTRGVGARRERIRPELFLKMELPFPGVDDQVRAISIFDRLHQLRQQETTIPTKLDAMLPAILDRVFRGEL